jgi:hypothetical protein
MSEMYTNCNVANRLAGTISAKIVMWANQIQAIFSVRGRIKIALPLPQVD